MNGKSRCKILKEIRKQIAEHNDIEFVTSECKYQGDCAGTCPKCEAEVRYLENELKKREMLGKRVVLAGLALSLVATSAGCMDNLAEDDTDSSINDELDGFMVAVPDFRELLSLNASDKNAYISRYNRTEIRLKWQNSEAILGNPDLGHNTDVFYVTENGVYYEIEVTYDENDRAVSVVVREVEEEFMGEPVEFMGDMAPPYDEDDEK